MAKSLLVVESPAKARTINRYLGNDFQVLASVGHIVDLPTKELGVDVEADFAPKYTVIPGKSRVINTLKKAAAAADNVYIATDDDREGEAIAWHIANTLRPKNPHIHRVRFHEITRRAVKSALEKPGEIDPARVNAQQARRILDRLVGYKVSPLLWKTVAKGLSAGRVQSVALRLICEREEEIAAFEPEEYWSLEALFRNPAGVELRAALLKIDGRKFRIPDADTARATEQEVRGTPFRISAVTRKEVKRRAAAPFITSTLQQDAARRLGFTARKTMMLAQQLYEGQELEGGEAVGLITYMRTDSRRIAPEAIAEVREFIGQRFPQSLPEKPNYYASAKQAQDAHEAIRPTSSLRTPETVKPFLKRDQYRLYQLIWQRFVASQMNPARFDQTTIDVEGGRFLFRATGSILKHPGFLEVYKPLEANNQNGKENNRDTILPEGLREDDPMEIRELFPEQHFTKPPPRYSESTLVKALDELGIGRPSTYASIISTIETRNYVARKEKRLHPTELGIIVNRILVASFPDLFNVEFTARMEENLDSIEQGADWLQILRDFYTPFNDTLTQVMARKKDIKAELQEKVGESCPQCGSDLVYKWGRNGKFIACSNFPECRYTRSLEGDNQAEETEEICEKCGAPMVLKESRYGKFLACSNYPKCRNTRPLDLGIACPREGCDGRLVQKRTKRGKVFYGCSRYPKCDYATWDEPVRQTCPHCGHPFLLRKTGRGVARVYCPACRKSAVQEKENQGGN